MAIEHTRKVVPMIHVPDVGATVEWYKDIGFKVVDTAFDEGEGLSFAMLSFGSSEVMFSEDGEPSSSHRREVDLYVYTNNIDELFGRLRDRVEVVEGPHDMFYGMREFIIRDLNRFWITFGQPTAFALLMAGVSEGNAECVRLGLESGSFDSDALTLALAVARADGDEEPEIAQMLRNAGAGEVAPVAEGVLQAHVGRYRSEEGLDVEVVLRDGGLFAIPNGQGPMRLIAMNETTFRPIRVDGVTIRFSVEAAKTTGLSLEQGGHSTRLARTTQHQG